MSEVVDLPPINWSLSYEEMGEDEFKRLEECDDENLRRLELQAHIQEDPERAILLCRIRLGRNINNIISWIHLAAAYERLGRFQEALDVYVDHVTRLDLANLERSETVIRRLKRKIKGTYFPGNYISFRRECSDRISGVHISTLIMYSLQADAEGDWESVVFFNDEMLKRNPLNIVSLLRKASALRRSGKLKEALVIFEQVVELQMAKDLTITRTISNISQIEAELRKVELDSVTSELRSSVGELVPLK